MEYTIQTDPCQVVNTKNNKFPSRIEQKLRKRYSDGFFIAQIMKNIPEDWNEQRRLFGFPEW